MDKPNKTHTSTGLELSQLFVGEDGILSFWTNEHEVEIVGAVSTIFGDGWNCKIK
jgi:hypothetical protein